MTNPVGVSNLYPYYTILYALSIIAVLIPAPGHFKAGTCGIILLTCWVLATQIILFVNSIIWRGNIQNIPIYCDISTVILAVASVGYEAGILCISRQLWKISKAQQVVAATKAEKRRDLIIDLLIGLGVPLLAGVGHGIVQGHRYDVYEDVGCWPTTYNVTLAYPLFLIWPLVVALISAVFGILSARNFLKRRRSFEMYLDSHKSGMQKGTYLRLMWLCCIDLVVCIPFFTYSIFANVTSSPVDPWVSWEVTQYDWYRVDFYRRLLIDIDPPAKFSLVTYMSAACAFAFGFFMFFGFTRETKKFYVNAYYWLSKSFGIKESIAPDFAANGPRKGTWLHRLLRREVIPLSSARGTTDSLPQFTQKDKDDASSSLSAYGGQYGRTI